MAFQTGSKGRAVTAPAKGNAPNTGAPGPTPAPAKTYVNPVVVERDAQAGYGQFKNLGPSSVPPGQSEVSDLGQELKRVNALGDAGDHLQDIINHGTARNSDVDLLAPQTRDVDASPYPTTFGMRSRNNEGVKVPATTGASVFDPNSIRKPGT